MKICVIPPDQKVPYPDHITSGQERVARDQAILLAEAGHHVDYWTVETPVDLQLPGVSHRIMPGCQARAVTEGAAQAAARKKWCVSVHDQYDIFVVHTDSSVFLKELTYAGVAKRIISWIHAPFAGTQWGIGFNSGQGLAKREGATIVSVSARCQEHWNKWSREMLRKAETGNLEMSRPDLLRKSIVHEKLVTEVICPQFSTLRSVVQSATGGPVVLSRIDTSKLVHNAFGLGVTFVLRQDQQPYYEEIKHRLAKEKHYLDLPHAECMSLLERASVIISTWPDETSGIAAFEAAERGIPAILCEKGEPHASRDFLPKWAYVTCAPTPEAIKAALASVDPEWYTLKFRKKLAAHMRIQFSRDRYAQQVVSLVDGVYKSTRGLRLIPVEREVFDNKQDDEQFHRLIEDLCSFASRKCKVPVKLAWNIRQKKRDGIPGEVNFSIVPLNEIYGSKAARMQKQVKRDVDHGVFLTLMRTDANRRDRPPMNIGTEVCFRLMTWNLPELDLGLYPADGPEWSQWKCLWTGKSYTLVDHGQFDLAKLSQLMKEAVTTCYHEATAVL